MMARDYSSAVVAYGQVFEWCVLSRAKDRFHLLASGRAERPAADAPPERLAALKQELAALKPPVAAGLPADQVLLRVVTLPTQDDAELGGMVQLQVDKFSPFPVESLVVSHEVLQRRADGTVVAIGAVREAAVDALGRQLAAAGVKLARVDVTVLGWWRALRDAGEIKPRGRQALLRWEDGGAELLALDDGVPVLFRALATEGATPESAAADVAREVRLALLALEIEHGPRGLCPLTIWRAGGEPAALVRALHAEGLLEVALRPLESLPSAAQGLARRGAAREGLDLTPPAWRAREQEQRFRRRMWSAAAAGLGLWLAAVGTLLGGLRIEAYRLRRAQLQLQALQAPAREIREVRRRVTLVRRYLNRRDAALECLREISALQPAGVTLTSFAYRQGEGLKLSGEAESVEQVYSFKTGLDESELFRSATLQGPQGRGEKQLFDIDLALAGAAREEP